MYIQVAAFNMYIQEAGHVKMYLQIVTGIYNVYTLYRYSGIYTQEWVTTECIYKCTYRINIYTTEKLLRVDYNCSNVWY